MIGERPPGGFARLDGEGARALQHDLKDGQALRFALAVEPRKRHQHYGVRGDAAQEEDGERAAPATAAGFDGVPGDREQS